MVGEMAMEYLDGRMARCGWAANLIGTMVDLDRKLKGYCWVMAKEKKKVDEGRCKIGLSSTSAEAWKMAEFVEASTGSICNRGRRGNSINAGC